MPIHPKPIHPTKPARVAAATMALLAVAGCSRQTPGTPGPATVSSGTGSPPSGTGTNQVTAPPVNNPLNASKFVADPCLTLTEKQVQQLDGSKPGSRNDSDNGVGCHWQLGGDGSAATDVSFVLKITNGLTLAYQQNAANFFEKGYFEPTDIEGYPAAYNSISDHRGDGACNLTVGFSDQSVFLVVIQWRPGKEACKAALNVAKATLHTIKGGQ